MAAWSRGHDTDACRGGQLSSRDGPAEPNRGRHGEHSMLAVGATRRLVDGLPAGGRTVRLSTGRPSHPLTQRRAL